MRYLKGALAILWLLIIAECGLSKDWFLMGFPIFATVWAILILITYAQYCDLHTGLRKRMSDEEFQRRLEGVNQ